MARKSEGPTMASETELTEVIAVAERDGPAGLKRLESLLQAYGGDARLHFLKGSLLAAQGAYPQAREAMQAAVRLAPGFAVARFQLGLLELSSGEAAAAVETLRPLETLPPDSALYLFARGLNHLIVDDFGPAIDLIEQGMAQNRDNPAMNRDMQLLVDGMRATSSDPAPGSEPVSAAHLLLQQYGNRTPSS
jgi:tetratricopeptide (TPR) repeat protein